jgi:hypothetical protein
MSIDERRPTPGAGPVSESSEHPEGAPYRESRGSSAFRSVPLTAAFVAISTIVLTGLVWSRQTRLFSDDIYPSGDAALNSLLVINSEHFSQVAGNYSRVGFHHPGAAFIYLLTAGEVFFDKLHLSPTPFNGQMAVTTVYATALFALVASCLGYLARSWLAGVLAVVLAFAFSAGGAWFGETWFPMLYAPAFLLFMASAAVLGWGRTRFLPLFVLASGLLVHGHVSFFLYVGVTGLVVLGGWSLAHRGEIRRELRRHRLAVFSSVGLLALFLLPLVVGTVRNFPSPWREYILFSRNAQNDPRTVSQVVAYVGTYWTETPWPVAVYGSAGLVLLMLLALDQRRRRRLGYAWVAGMLLLQSVLAVFYAYRGVDQLEPREVAGYVLLYYEMVPLLLVLAASTYLVSVVVTAARPVAITGRVLAAAAAIAILTVAYTTTRVATSMPGDGLAYHDAAVVMRDDPARQGLRVGLLQADPSAWADVAGVGLELDRLGVPWCVGPASSGVANLYTAAHVCPAGDEVWVIGVTTKEPPAGEAVLAHLPSTSVYG